MTFVSIASPVRLRAAVELNMKIHDWPRLFLVLLLVFLPAKGLTETAEAALLSTALITSDRFELPQTESPQNREHAVELKAHSQRFSSLSDE